MISSPSGWASLAIGALLALAGCDAKPTAATLLRESAAAMRAGNVSQARRLATQAVASDSTSGAAHVAAAEAALAEGDGITAEGEVSRAADAGVDPRTTRHLYAHARLLQGDASGALAASRSVDAAHWVYGARIQARALTTTGDNAGAATLWRVAAARAPRDAALWADIGTARLAAGDQGGAGDAAARAVALGPDLLAALLLHARVERTRVGLAAAVPWYEAALRRDPHSYAALVELAATLGDMGQARAMLATARRALAVRPGDPQASYLLAVLAARAGNVPLARAMFDRTGDTLRGVPAALLLGATLDLQTGAHEQAVARLRNLLGLQPMNLRARQLLAVALLRLNAVDDALATLRPIALRDDADAYTLLVSARAFERAGNRAQAGVLIDRAAAGPPGSAAVFSAEDSVTVAAATADARPASDLSAGTSLIRSLLEAKDTSAALQRAALIARTDPKSADAQIVLGDTLFAAGRGGEAITAYRRAAKLRFDEPVMLRLLRALEASGDRAGAAAVLAAFITQHPASGAAQRLSATGLLAAGDPSAAVDTLERLHARLGGRDAALLGNLAAAYAAGDNWPVAADYAAAAYRLAPSSAAAAHLYGWAAYRAGQPRAALPIFAKAVRLAPRDASVRWHLAQVYATLGRAADARAQATAALSDPRFTERAAAQDLIAQLA